jgi:hypothetical protein
VRGGAGAWALVDVSNHWQIANAGSAIDASWLLTARNRSLAARITSLSWKFQRRSSRNIRVSNLPGSETFFFPAYATACGFFRAPISAHTQTRTIGRRRSLLHLLESRGKSASTASPFAHPLNSREMLGAPSGEAGASGYPGFGDWWAGTGRGCPSEFRATILCSDGWARISGWNGGRQSWPSYNGWTRRSRQSKCSQLRPNLRYNAGASEKCPRACIRARFKLRGPVRGGYFTAQVYS